MRGEGRVNRRIINKYYIIESFVRNRDRNNNPAARRPPESKPGQAAFCDIWQMPSITFSERKASVASMIGSASPGSSLDLRHSAQVMLKGQEDEKLGALRIPGNIKSGGDDSPPGLLLNRFVGCEDGDLRMPAADTDRAKIFACDQYRHHDGNTEDYQGNNHYLVPFHRLLLLDPKVGKRLT